MLLIFEKNLLELLIWRTNIAVLVVPLVDGSVGQPCSSFASIITGSCCTFACALVIEGNRLVPALVFRTLKILGLLLGFGCSSVVSDGVLELGTRLACVHITRCPVVYLLRPQTFWYSFKTQRK